MHSQQQAAPHPTLALAHSRIQHTHHATCHATQSWTRHHATRHATQAALGAVRASSASEASAREQEWAAKCAAPPLP